MELMEKTRKTWTAKQNEYEKKYKVDNNRKNTFICH